MSKVQILFLLFFPIYAFSEKITIIGSNYVGLATAAVLLQCGHEVTCVDIDTKKIEQLKQGKLTLHEPKLANDLFNSPYSSKCLFTNNIRQALHSPIIYICVGTPTDESGKCDCKDIYMALNDIARFSTESKIICIKSTLPPGTTKQLKAFFTDSAVKFHLIYHPEFMRQGSAIEDIMTKNPIVLGGDSDHQLSRIECLYSNLIEKGTPVIKTNYETAELIKYGWNSFSAIRIAYINELSVLSREFSGDIFKVIEAIALSEILLPTAELRPGPGYGGSCLPKDTKAFATIIEEKEMPTSMVHQAISSNQQHIQNLIKSIYQSLNHHVANQKIAILGLTFKANTDDIRYAPSIDIISSLKNDGAIIHAYDLYAAKSMKTLFPDIAYFDSPYDAAQGVDCVLVLTDWDELKNIDLKKLSLLCNKKILFDPRNLYHPKVVKDLGFQLFNLGRI